MGGEKMKAQGLQARRLLRYVENIGLTLIVVATVIAVAQEVITIYEARRVALADLLLLFIYMEVIAMVAIYIESGQLPVRVPLYIALVALARFLILEMKALDWLQLLAVAGAALLLALTVLVIRYGHVRYPYTREPEISRPASKESEQGHT